MAQTIRRSRDRRRSRRLCGGDSCGTARVFHGVHRVRLVRRSEGRSASRRHLPQCRLHSVQGAAAVVGIFRHGQPSLPDAWHQVRWCEDGCAVDGSPQGEHRHPAHLRNSRIVQEEQGDPALRSRQFCRQSRKRLVAGRSGGQGRQDRRRCQARDRCHRVACRDICLASRSTTRSSATTSAHWLSTTCRSGSA